MILKHSFEQINVDRYGADLSEPSKCFNLFSSFKILPLLLSKSDNVQIQKHRHLLRFKGTGERKMNADVAGLHLSAWHSKALNALFVLCSTEETLKRAILSVVWVRQMFAKRYGCYWWSHTAWTVRDIETSFLFWLPGVGSATMDSQ